MNAASMLINPLNLASASRLFFFVCSAFRVTQQCLYICNLIYLSTESNNEMVLFNLLTCLTEEICQNEMFTNFSVFPLVR